MNAMDRRGVAPGRSFARRSYAEELAREQAMGGMLIATRGYSTIEYEVVESMPHAPVVASSHKVVDGKPIVASALGVDELDATRKLVKVVMRP